MEDIYDVANYVMSKKGISRRKIQKIIYYAYSIYLAKYNDEYSDNMNKLFEADFEAWGQGPVNRRIYDYLNEICDSDNLCFNKEEVKFKDSKSKYFLDQIIKEYGKYSGHELEKMTKKENPWFKSYVYPIWCGAIPSGQIKDRNIYEYFRKII